MLRVLMVDARVAGYCAKGIRAFCDKHGFDYLDFVQNGISAELLINQTNSDALAVAVVEIARERWIKESNSRV